MSQEQDGISMYDIWNAVEPNCDGMKVAVMEEDIQKRDTFPGYNGRIIKMETFTSYLDTTYRFLQRCPELKGTWADTSYTIREYTICAAPLTAYCTPRMGMCGDCKQRLKIVVFPSNLSEWCISRIAEAYNHTDGVTVPITKLVLNRGGRCFVRNTPPETDFDLPFPHLGKERFVCVDRKVNYKSVTVF